MNVYPEDHQFMGFKTEYISNNTFASGAENFFADLVYRYTWEAKSIDFELQWNNIFNTKDYRTVDIADFSYLESNFR